MKGFIRAAYCAVDVFVAGVADLGQQFARGGIDHIEQLRASGGYFAPVDEQSVDGRLICFSSA